MKITPANKKQPQNNDQSVDHERDDQNAQEAVDPMDILPDNLETDDVYRAIRSRPPNRIGRFHPDDKEQFS